MATIPVGPGALPPEGPGTRLAAPPPRATEPFTQVMEYFLSQANNERLQADQAVRDMVLGRTDEMHQVMLAVAKADLSFRMALELRNRISEAYQEIMRMQV